MVSKLIVVTKNNSRKEAAKEIYDFLNGSSSLFHSFSLIKMISDQNEVIDNLGCNQLSLSENEDDWNYEFKASKLETEGVNFEEWLTAQKYLLRDINSFEEVQELSREIVNQTSNYTDVLSKISEYHNSNVSVTDNHSCVKTDSYSNLNPIDMRRGSDFLGSQDTFCSLRVLIDNHQKQLDYQDCMEYFMIKHCLEIQEIESVEEFDLMKHHFFLPNFILNQIVHTDIFSSKYEEGKVWIGLVEIYA